jgi:hypothetical protein
VRRLPGPADCRLSEGDHTPGVLYELFRDWQRTQTQSSVTAHLEPETANGCLVLPRVGTDAERHTLRTVHPEFIGLRTLPSAPGTPVPPLDSGLHGRRQSGNNHCPVVT